MTPAAPSITIDLRTLYAEQAKLADIPAMIAGAIALAGKGNAVVITGQAPVWMYLVIAHALHGTARSLTYTSPVSGDVVVFDHDPF